MAKTNSELISGMIFDMCTVARKYIDKGILPDGCTILLTPDGCTITDSHHVVNDMLVKRDNPTEIYNNIKQEDVNKILTK